MFVILRDPRTPRLQVAGPGASLTASQLLALAPSTVSVEVLALAKQEAGLIPSTQVVLVLPRTLAADPVTILLVVRGVLSVRLLSSLAEIIREKGALAPCSFLLFTRKTYETPDRFGCRDLVLRQYLSNGRRKPNISQYF